MPTTNPKESGWIEVICGPMFSGKTEELIRRLIRAQFAKQKVAIFKPRTDDRYSDDYIVSHNKRKIKSIILDSAKEIYKFKEGLYSPKIQCPIEFKKCLCIQ